MQRIRSLVLLTGVICLLSSSVAAEAPIDARAAAPAKTTVQAAPESSNLTQVADRAMWLLGIAEDWLQGWLAFWFAVWIAGLWLAPSRVRQANKWFGRIRIGGLRFGGGAQLTAAHLVLVRLFAAPESTDEQSPCNDSSPEESGKSSVADREQPEVGLTDKATPVADAAAARNPLAATISGSVSPEFEPPVIDRLAEAVHRHTAISILARVEQVLQAVVNALVDDSRSETLLSRAGTMTQPDDEVTESLRRTMPDNARKDDVGDLRRAAVQSVGRLGPMAADAVPGLTLMLNDPHVDCRRGAAVALGWIGPDSSEAAPLLAQLVADDNRSVRAAASKALGAIGRVNREIIGALCKAAQDEAPKVRIAAIRSLGALGVGWPEAVPVLRTALCDDHPEIRREASESLGQMGPLAKGAMDDLTHLMLDGSVPVRRSAVVALSKIDLAAVPILNQALEDEDVEVRRIAATALSGIGLAAVPALISKLHKYGTAAEPNANDLMHSEPTQQRCEADEPHSVDVGSPLAVE